MDFVHSLEISIEFFDVEGKYYLHFLLYFWVLYAFYYILYYCFSIVYYCVFWAVSRTHWVPLRFSLPRNPDNLLMDFSLANFYVFLELYCCWVERFTFYFEHFFGEWAAYLQNCLFWFHRSRIIFYFDVNKLSLFKIAQMRWCMTFILVASLKGQSILRA